MNSSLLNFLSDDGVDLTGFLLQECYAITICEHSLRGPKLRNLVQAPTNSSETVREDKAKVLAKSPSNKQPTKMHVFFQIIMLHE